MVFLWHYVQYVFKEKILQIDLQMTSHEGVGVANLLGFPVKY